MHPGAVREILLRYAEPFALCAYPGTEALEVGLAHDVHVLVVMPIGLQSMSIIGDRIECAHADRAAAHARLATCGRGHGRLAVAK